MIGVVHCLELEGRQVVIYWNVISIKQYEDYFDVANIVDLTWFGAMANHL